MRSIDAFYIKQKLIKIEQYRYPSKYTKIKHILKNVVI